jgi:probable HAF family extracellular repeat protein
MTALPTLGGNNGQASAINSRGEVVGNAETTATEADCPFHTAPPVLWEHGAAQTLPTVEGDTDGFAFDVNSLGQAVGGTGVCTALLHVASWQDGVATELSSLGGLYNNMGMAVNNEGEVVGMSDLSGDMTFHATLWQNGTISDLGIIGDDFASMATGINSKGRVVGTSFDENFNPSHAFIWQNGVMTDLNTLIPGDSNLFIIAASNINEHGQISGMAMVMSGPDKGKIHALLLTPVNERIGTSVADVARTHPGSILPANVHRHHLQNFGLAPFGR